jgi:hypothetical protein
VLGGETELLTVDEEDQAVPGLAEAGGGVGDLGQEVRQTAAETRHPNLRCVDMDANQLERIRGGPGRSRWRPPGFPSRPVEIIG